jgi:leader peptidase (prepilin peptidase)/N-methyltransferase
MIAAFFGWWPAVLALFVGTITATAFAVIQMARGRADRLTELPYGSFLAIGGLITAMAGPMLIEWYAGLLR